MSDLQAKYNALLRKFIGDSTLVIDGDTENELAKDIAAAMKEKAKRNAEVAKVSQEAQVRVNSTFDGGNYFESALCTLQEHNELKRKLHDEGFAKKNGIACPKCGHEMVDTNPGMLLTSNPPQKDVHCPMCSHHDYALA